MMILSGKILNESLEQAPQVHKRSANRLPVVEVFGPTIQGEGALLGHQTMFIRFGGCDFRCTKCDSLHAVLPDEVKKNAAYLTSGEIAGTLQEHSPRFVSGSGGVPWVTLSGGNPAMNDLTELLHILQELGYRVALETQGSLWQEWIKACDMVTISPKGPGMGEKFVDRDFNRFAEELTVPQVWRDYCVKVVILDRRDIEFAIFLLQKWPDFLNGHTYLSLGNPFPPQDALTGADIRPALLDSYRVCVEEILTEPALRHCIITPQLHVALWGNRQGV